MFRRSPAWRYHQNATDQDQMSAPTKADEYYNRKILIKILDNFS